MSTANLNRSEVAERSRAISVAGYRVELDLRSAVDSAVKTFSTVTTIDLTSSVESTWLDFVGAAVDSWTSTVRRFRWSTTGPGSCCADSADRTSCEWQLTATTAVPAKGCTDLSTTLTIRRICTRNTSLPMPGVFSPASSSRTSRRPSHSR